MVMAMLPSDTSTFFAAAFERREVLILTILRAGAAIW